MTKAIFQTAPITTRLTNRYFFSTKANSYFQSAETQQDLAKKEISPQFNDYEIIEYLYCHHKDLFILITNILQEIPSAERPYHLPEIKALIRSLIPDVITSDYKLQLTKEIKKHLPTAKIYLYGSRATNTHRPTSDIDLAIDADIKIDPNVMANINKGIERLNLSLEVEVVDMHAVSHGHLKRIEKEKIQWRE